MKHLIAAALSLISSATLIGATHNYEYNSTRTIFVTASTSGAGNYISHIWTDAIAPNGAATRILDWRPSAGEKLATQQLNQPLSLSQFGEYTIKSYATASDGSGDAEGEAPTITIQTTNPYSDQWLWWQIQPNGAQASMWIARSTQWNSQAYRVYKYNIPGAMPASPWGALTRYNGQTTSIDLPTDAKAILRAQPGWLKIQGDWYPSGSTIPATEYIYPSASSATFTFRFR